MAKVKDKHEKDFNEVIAENRRCNEKIEAYELKLQKISTQIHRLNEEKLQLWKDNEMMKTKLRSVNINYQLNGNSATNMFEGKIYKSRNSVSCKFIQNNINSYFRQAVHLKWKMKRANYSTTLTWTN